MKSPILLRLPLTAAVLFIPLIPPLLAAAFFVPVFRTNDDVAMNMLALGVGFTAEPTPLLLYSHHWLGGLLNSAYSAWPGLPWYHLYGVVAQYLAGVVMVYSALHRRFSLTRVILVLLATLVFGLLFSTGTHFTIVAACCATAASLLWHERIAHDEILGPGLLAMFFGLWFASALIRYQSAVMVFLLAVPLFAYHGVRIFRARDDAKRRWIAAVLLPVLGTGILIAALSWTYRAKYVNDPAWDDFNRTEHLIVDLIDYGRGSVARGDERVYAIAAEQAGWSANDHDMMMAWFFAHPEIYSEANLSAVAAAMPGRGSGGLQSLELLRLDDHLLILLAITLLPLAFIERRGAAAWPVFLVACGAIALMTYLILGLDRFPNWVYQPILAFVCWHAVLRTKHGPLVPTPGAVRSWVGLALLAAVVGLMPTTWRVFHRNSQEVVQANAGLKSALAELDEGGDSLYVVWGSEFPYEALVPTDDMNILRTLNIYSVGGDTRSAYNAAQLERFGIDDIHRALYENPAVRLIGNDRLNRLLVLFIEEHYGERVLPVVVARFGSAAAPVFSVYRFERTTVQTGP